MFNLRLSNTEEVHLDYVLDAENNDENRQYIIPWSREKHIEAMGNPDVAHLIVENETRIGYVILVGLLDSNQTIEFRRIVITEKGRGYGKATVEIIKKLAKEINHKGYEEKYAENRKIRVNSSLFNPENERIES